jgi:hypothetical protein
LQRIQQGMPLVRPPSPLFDGLNGEGVSSSQDVNYLASRLDDVQIQRSNSEPPESKTAPEQTSSWSRWWRGNKKADTLPPSQASITTKPLEKPVSGRPSLSLSITQTQFQEPFSGNLATRRISKSHTFAESAPALPSTPVDSITVASRPSETPKASAQQPAKRFAKTLRLTSDQLVSLQMDNSTSLLNSLQTRNP